MSDTKLARTEYVVVSPSKAGNIIICLEECCEGNLAKKKKEIFPATPRFEPGSPTLYSTSNPTELHRHRVTILTKD